MVGFSVCFLGWDLIQDALAPAITFSGHSLAEAGLGSTKQAFVNALLIGVHIFLTIHLGFGFWKKTDGKVAIFRAFSPRIHTSNVLVPVYMGPGHPAGTASLRFLHCKLLFLPFSLLYSGRKLFNPPFLRAHKVVNDASSSK